MLLWKVARDFLHPLYSTDLPIAQFQWSRHSLCLSSHQPGCISYHVKLIHFQDFDLQVPLRLPSPVLSLSRFPYSHWIRSMPSLWFVGFHTSPKSDEQSVSFYLPTFFSCSHIPISLIRQSSFINALILSAHSIIFKSLSHGLFHRCLSLRPYVIRPYVLLCPNVLWISRWFYTTLPSLFPKQLGMKGLEGLIFISPSSHQVPEAYPLYINIWSILCTCGGWVIGF